MAKYRAIQSAGIESAVQYDGPVLLFVTRPPGLSYYIALVVKGSPDDKRRLSTITLTEYVFLADVMVVINATDGACASYCTQKPGIDDVEGSLLFRLPVKYFDPLKYLGSYIFAHRISTDPV